MSNDFWLKRNSIWIALYRCGFDIRIEYKIPEISTRIEDYRTQPFFKNLKKIYDFLVPYDKSKNFKKTGRIGHSGHLEDCDIFLTNSNQVVELDEKQHFNSLRGEVLGLYPPDLPLAFNKEKYRKKCAAVKTSGNVTAVGIWNDVLRDFLPLITGINPTARIDISEISKNIWDIRADVTLDYLKSLDGSVEFLERKKGEVSKLQYKDSVSRNVDEEKNFIYRYLLDQYETVYWGYPSYQHAELQDYANSKGIYPSLRRIHRALEKHRNGKVVIGRRTLASYDIYIPGESIIVELDEFRHFTEPRAVSLENYPEALKVAFDKDEYLMFCMQIDAKDNDRKKPYRDEQRAWYDVLRDFTPLIDGKSKPVIRIPLFDTKKATMQLDRESIIKRIRNGLKVH